MSIETIILLTYFGGAAASFKLISKMANEKVEEDYRTGKVKADTAYAVFAVTVIVSVALWPILAPMRLYELVRYRSAAHRKRAKAAATKRSKRRR